MARRSELKSLAGALAAASVLSVAHTARLVCDGRGWAFMAVVSGILVAETVIVLHALTASPRAPRDGGDAKAVNGR